MGKYHQGLYRPKNPQKYVGDPTNIVYRSSWEKKVLLWLDQSESCLRFSSEETIIPYISPIDKKVHRYFVDFLATFRQTDGTIKTYLIEVKPYAQTIPPKQSRNRKILMESMMTYAVNQSKWEAARKYCAQKGYEFVIVTEYELGIKKKSS